MLPLNLVSCPKCNSQEMSESRFLESVSSADIDPIETPFPPPDSAWMYVCARCGKRILKPA